MRELDSMKGYDAGGYIVGFGPNNHNGSAFVELTRAQPAPWQKP